MFPKELEVIKYGNATIEQKRLILEESYLDAIKNEIISNPENKPPANSSGITVAEIHKLIELSKELSGTHLTEYRERYKMHDIGLVEFFKEGIKNIEGINVLQANRLIDNVLYDTIGLITKLKYHYQRPRPFQLAYYYNLPLHHHESLTIDSPSYPSGHAYMSRILTGVIGHVYPQLYGFMEKVSLDFNNARKFMGVHYPSDVAAGVAVAEMVLNNRAFKKKHNL